jgi:diketogulonate reductase-like aldo/keto reductase
MGAPTEMLQFPGRLGLGTWMMGTSPRARSGEVAAVARALDIGYRLFDTAELYAEGGAERILGEALGSFGNGRRAELCIVSKVLPQNASRSGTVRACEASIERIGCEYLDLYLLHWRGSQRFADTLAAFEELLRRGLIRHYGVSNFGVEDLSQWLEQEKALGLAGRTQCNQLQTRTIEATVIPWQRKHHIQTMAYSPLGRGALTRQPALAQLARERGATPAQIALAWCLRLPDVVAIPKSAHAERVDENWQAATLQLRPDELAQLERAFPAPRVLRR